MKVEVKSTVHDHIVDECDDQNLTPFKVYSVCEIGQDVFRVLNDRDEPILYPKALFRVVDINIPVGWVMQEFEDGEYWIGPCELASPGFYEDYFDRNPEAVAKFEMIKKRADGC
jgi:hypothetical protein